MIRKILVANWKMNHTRSTAEQYFRDFFNTISVSELGKSLKVNFAVPYTLLTTAQQLLIDSPCQVLAQNVHWLEKGAYTGEISLGMLADIGITSTLIGHSERRQYYAETDETVALKVKAALAAECTPLLCIGENLQQRQAGETHAIITKQLTTVLNTIPSGVNLQIAYEPVWAIGTGLAATSQQAQEVHELIRGLLRKAYGATLARTIPVLYGGSVTLTNVEELMAQQDIDGALVGGASLQGETFAQLAKLIIK